MNKKGFSLIELLATIVVLGIIITLAVIEYNRFLVKGKNDAYKVAEESLKNSAKDAIVDCTVNNKNTEICKDNTIPANQYEYRFITLADLIDSDYIEPIHDPADTERLCDKDLSYVYIINNSDTSKTNNSDLEYKTCLVCGDFKSDDCIDNISSKSDFNISCFLSYDSDGNNLYNSEEWTDQNLYLNLSVNDIENIKYGIKYFEYELKGKRIRGGSNNKASFVIKDILEDVSIKAYAVDGMGNEANVVCPSIKMDKTKILSAYINGKEINGKEISSYNEHDNIWASDDVVLTVLSNPKTIPSGYYYQWYKDGVMVKDWSTDSTYLANEDGSYFAIVSNRWQYQQVKTKEFIVKIDRTVPVINAKVNPLALGKEDYNFLNNNITYSFGPSGGKVSCDPADSLKTGVYTVTCTAKGNNRLEVTTEFEAKHSYPAIESWCETECKYLGTGCQMESHPNYNGGCRACDYSCGRADYACYRDGEVVSGYGSGYTKKDKCWKCEKGAKLGNKKKGQDDKTCYYE